MKWFIIHDNDHLGPFTEDFLSKMYRDGQLIEESLLWTEGMEGPSTFKRIFIDPKSSNQFKAYSRDVQLEKVEELPPDLPPDIPVDARKKKDTLVTEMVTEGDNIQTRRKTTIAGKLGVVGIGIFGVAITIAVFTYLNSNKTFSRPKKMSLADFDRLQTIAEKKVNKVAFGFAFAKDKSTLWAATNSHAVGPVTLKLSSMPGRVLGEEKIEVVTNGYLEHGLITFERFKFSSGTKLLDGNYQVELETRGKLGLPFWHQFSEEPQLEFQYYDEILISAMTKEKFEAELDRLTKTKISNENSFWAELGQKYQTLKAITTQIRESLVRIFDDNANFATAVKKFENDYKLNYGQFFTNFVISNEDSYTELAAKTFNDKVEILSGYTRLSSLARSVGDNSMEILNNLEKVDSSDQMQIGQVKQTSLEMLDQIISECDLKIAIIQDK